MSFVKDFSKEQIFWVNKLNHFLKQSMHFSVQLSSESVASKRAGIHSVTEKVRELQANMIHLQGSDHIPPNVTDVVKETSSNRTKYQ